ncbi:hypothetical protein [Mesorhizobium sp.]|uniref:hypothetical protein n=1 Tax=Mesorhizobium sp. TaxID=1871066 RepID=UPI00257F942D|nr:hypothetical protein [Mesorhizobium sp.]
MSDEPELRRRYTTKQMGDACEMIVAAELTLAGIPALKVPDNWPGCDVIAQPVSKPPQRISVKSRTFNAAFVLYMNYDVFDWLAIVILANDQSNNRDVYLIPRSLTDEIARRDNSTAKNAEQRYWRVDEVERVFGRFRNNFTLDPAGAERPIVLQPRSPDRGRLVQWRVFWMTMVNPNSRRRS